VDSDGLVLTKRSELTGPKGPRPLVCRLASGDDLEPKVLAESREHDLALLKVSARGPAGRGVEQVGPACRGPADRLARPRPAALAPRRRGGAARQEPRDQRLSPDQRQDGIRGTPGMVFTKLLPSNLAIDEELRDALQPGDLITHLNGMPTPSADEFAAVRDRCIRATHVHAGEWLELTVPAQGENRAGVPATPRQPRSGVPSARRFPTTGFPGNKKGRRDVWNATHEWLPRRLLSRRGRRPRPLRRPGGRSVRPRDRHQRRSRGRHSNLRQSRLTWPGTWSPS